MELQALKIKFIDCSLLASWITVHWPGTSLLLEYMFTSQYPKLCTVSVWSKCISEEHSSPVT